MCDKDRVELFHWAHDILVFRKNITLFAKKIFHNSHKTCFSKKIKALSELYNCPITA